MEPSSTFELACCSPSPLPALTIHMPTLRYPSTPDSILADSDSNLAASVYSPAGAAPTTPFSFEWDVCSPWPSSSSPSSTLCSASPASPISSAFEGQMHADANVWSYGTALEAEPNDWAVDLDLDKMQFELVPELDLDDVPPVDFGFFHPWNSFDEFSSPVAPANVGLTNYSCLEQEHEPMWERSSLVRLHPIRWDNCPAQIMQKVRSGVSQGICPIDTLCSFLNFVSSVSREGLLQVCSPFECGTIPEYEAHQGLKNVECFPQTPWNRNATTEGR
ncbi:hypothetical protein K438DRAFT_1770000 [Mycena galopus ATCC 62051]|nr:hypothetical protein K438DRAFT_1770000 [Mycena galopus ATCC 62051]